MRTQNEHPLVRRVSDDYVTASVLFFRHNQRNHNIGDDTDSADYRQKPDQPGAASKIFGHTAADTGHPFVCFTAMKMLLVLFAHVHFLFPTLTDPSGGERPYYSEQAEDVSTAAVAPFRRTLLLCCICGRRTKAKNV